MEIMRKQSLDSGTAADPEIFESVLPSHCVTGWESLIQTSTPLVTTQIHCTEIITGEETFAAYEQHVFGWYSMIFDDTPVFWFLNNDFCRKL